MQRHHLLPCQLQSSRCFGPPFAAIGPRRLSFDDFRSNGLLLPASAEIAVRMGLPLHRGPHGRYNALVAERLGRIEAEWATRKGRHPDSAVDRAVMRVALLQQALRKRLLAARRKPMRLNRADPLGAKLDFSDLDAMVDGLWRASET